MRLDEIKRRHETLESIRSTLSVKQTAERRSQAHRDRAYLLELVEQLATKLESSENK